MMKFSAPSFFKDKAAWLLVLLSLTLPIHAQPLAWQAASAVSTGTGNANITATALDAAGNTVAVGAFEGTVAFGNTTLVSAGDYDVYVAWLNPAGVPYRAVRGGGVGADQAKAVGLDAAGNVVVAGVFSGGATAFGTTALPHAGLTGTNDLFVARLSATGQWTQAVRAGGNDDDVATALAVDAAGNVALTGWFGSSSLTLGSFSLANASPSFPTEDVFVARLSPAGTWTQAVRAGGRNGEKGTAIAFDGSGNAVVGGDFDGSITFGTFTLNSPAGASTQDLFVARLSAAGQWVQAVRAGSAFLSHLLLESSGNVAIAGTFYSATASFGAFSVTNSNPGNSTSDMFVARLSAAGQWTQAASAGSLGYDTPQGLAFDGAGGLVLGGNYRTADMRFGTIILPPPAAYDVFVARLNAAGTWTSAIAAGSAGIDGVGALALLPNGNVQVVGFVSTPSATFGQFSFATTAYNAFVAQAGNTVLATRPVAATAALACFPNPARTHATLQVPVGQASPLVLLDALGRPVRTYPLPAHATTATLDLTGLAPGLYVVRCGAASAKLVVE